MYFFGRFLLPVHTLIVIYVCFKSIEAETETSSYSCPGGPQACSWGRQWKGESSSWSAFHCSLSFFAMEQKTCISNCSIFFGNAKMCFYIVQKNVV